MLAPVRSQPFNIFFDGIHEFHSFLCRIGIVKTHMERAAVFSGKPIIQKDGFGMSDMQITVGLRREPRAYMIVHSFPEILIDLLLDKIL